MRALAAPILSLVLAVSASCGDDSPGTNNNGNNQNTLVCGNDQQEGSEECDGADLGGQDCLSRGFDSGVLGCTGACTVDETD